MQEIPILTDTLARRIESYFAEGYATGERFGNSAKPKVQRFGKTVVIKSILEPWRNGVFCFSEEDVLHLGNIISFFDDDNTPFQFYISQVGISEVVCRALTNKGIFPVHGSQALTYAKPQKNLFQIPNELSIEEVTNDTLDIFCDIQFRGFGYPSQWRDGLKEAIFSRYQLPGIHFFLIRFHSTVAGSGTLIIRDGLGGLMDTAVIPEYRSKGCHFALLKHRIGIAERLGCELVISGAHYGSPSFRNQCRAGLQIAYIETTWRRINTES